MNDRGESFQQDRNESALDNHDRRPSFLTAPLKCQNDRACTLPDQASLRLSLAMVDRSFPHVREGSLTYWPARVPDSPCMS